MDTIKIVIRSQYSDFKKFLDDFVFGFFRSSIHRPIQYSDGDGEFSLQYTFLGALIVYKVLVIDRDNLDIEISASGNYGENTKIHIDEVTTEIRKKFSSGDFPFGFKNLILNDEHCQMMENLWIESEKTQKAQAYLSTIVILGSILEGLLLYKINETPENMEQANKCTSSPKDTKTKKVLPFDKWTLADMIIVSHKCGWINEYSYNYSESLRKHRNFVHPFQQLDEMFTMPSEGACELSRTAFKAIFNDLVNKKP